MTHRRRWTVRRAIVYFGAVAWLVGSSALPSLNAVRSSAARAAPVVLSAFVHVDVADFGVTPVQLSNGAAVAWAQADQTADHTHDGHVYPSALQQLATMNLGYLRYPSGEFSNCFDWSKSVGPMASRGTMLINWDPLSNNHPCYRSGTDVFGTDEFMTEVSHLSTLEHRRVEPVITVNVCSVSDGANCGTGDYPQLCPNPQDAAGGGCPGAVEAAHWVEYLNGDATTQFGAQRAANTGRAAPYGVRFFEIGNETPISQTPDRPYYAEVLSAYAHAMRAVDPTIKIMAQGDCGCANDLDTARVSSLLAHAGADIDYLAPHIYIADGDLTGGVTRYLEALHATIDGAGYHDRVGVFPTEWTAHDESTQQLDPNTRFGDMSSVLADASEIQAFMTQQVTGSTYFTVDGDPFHLIHCSTVDPKDNNDPCADPATVPYLSIPGRMLRLFSSSVDAWGLHTSSSPQLHATATADRGVVHVQVVNATDQPQTTAFSFHGMTMSGATALQGLTGPLLADGVLRGQDIPVSSSVLDQAADPLVAWQVILVTIPARSVSVLTGHMSSSVRAEIAPR